MSEQGSAASVDAVYTERNQAVAVLATLAQRLGYPVRLFYGDGEDAEWPVVFIELPHAGQVSWHIPRAELGAFFPRGIPQLLHNPWDGHDNAEKAGRLAREARA